MSDQQQHQIQPQGVKEIIYMAEEEIANYNPPDFNSQAQCQLSEFILLTSPLYNRKIPHKAFADFNDLVYDRREELRDQEYMDIMDRLSMLLPHTTKECSCVPTSNQFCSSGIDEFLYCHNYPKWASLMPQIEFIRFTREHPNYSNKQLYEFLAKFCRTPLQIHIGLNPDNIDKDNYIEKYVGVVKHLILLCEANPVCKIGRALLIVMNFKFCLENISTNWGNDLSQMQRLYCRIHDQCSILSEQCISPIRQQLLNILGCQDCPFKTIQQLMTDNRQLLGFDGIPA